MKGVYVGGVRTVDIKTLRRGAVGIGNYSLQHALLTTALVFVLSSTDYALS